MKLFLTSTGITNATLRQKLVELVGKPLEETTVCYVMTAINVSHVLDKRWAVNNIRRLDDMKVKNIDILDFAAVSKEIWLARVELADVIYVEGGTPTYLASEMERTGFLEVIKEYPNKVYVGCSASSMILGEVYIKSSAEESLYKIEKGLGFYNFSIRPHFYRKDKSHFLTEEFVATVAKNNNTTIYAIDDDTGISIEDGKPVVISEGKWSKFDASEG